MREPISPATSSSGTTGPGSTPDSATSLPKKYSTSGQKASEWRRNRQFNRSEIFGADQTPVRAPRANPIAERFVGLIRRELLDRILIISQRHAAAVLTEYAEHYNSHRPHRTLGQAAPLRPPPRRTTSATTGVRRRDRLGGLLHEYQQVA